MLKKASTPTRVHHSRGMRTASPATRATTSIPSAANGSVTARKVSGASSSTPIFRIGQLKPHTSISTTTMGRAARVVGGDAVCGTGETMGGRAGAGYCSRALAPLGVRACNGGYGRSPYLL
jgi:hypothetical protein